MVKLNSLAYRLDEPTLLFFGVILDSNHANLLSILRLVSHREGQASMQVRLDGWWSEGELGRKNVLGLHLYISTTSTSSNRPQHRQGLRAALQKGGHGRPQAPSVPQ